MWLLSTVDSTLLCSSHITHLSQKGQLVQKKNILLQNLFMFLTCSTLQAHLVPAASSLPSSVDSNHTIQSSLYQQLLIKFTSPICMPMARWPAVTQTISPLQASPLCPLTTRVIGETSHLYMWKFLVICKFWPISFIFIYNFVSAYTNQHTQGLLIFMFAIAA